MKGLVRPFCLGGGVELLQIYQNQKRFMEPDF